MNQTDTIENKETYELVTDTHQLSRNNNDLVKKSLAKAITPGTLDGLKSNDIINVINGMKSQISQALPKHLTAERIIQIASTYLSGNAEIKKCTAASIVGAIVQSSIYGLELSPAFGHVYLVPYNRKVGNEWIKEAQFQIGYKGYIKLAQNSNEIKTIYSEVVRDGDVFACELGLEPKLKHIPNLNGTGDEPITHAYAVVHYKHGGYNFAVITKNKIESLRKRNSSQKNGISGAWFTDYESMAKAKAIHQLKKYMPMSTEMQKIYESDGAIFGDKCLTNNGDGVDITAVTYEDISDDAL